MYNKNKGDKKFLSSNKIVIKHNKQLSEKQNQQLFTCFFSKLQSICVHQEYPHFGKESYCTVYGTDESLSEARTNEAWTRGPFRRSSATRSTRFVHRNWERGSQRSHERIQSPLPMEAEDLEEPLIWVHKDFPL